MERTIASNNKEFIFFRDLVNCHVRIGGDDLFLSNQGVVLLELKVSQSPRESKVAWEHDEQNREKLKLPLTIDATIFDIPASAGYPRLLGCNSVISDLVVIKTT